MAGTAPCYQVRLHDLHAHLFHVTLTIPRPAARQRVSLPVWIPGSYLIREFSKNLQQLQARQGGQRIALTQLDKCSWELDCKAGKPLELEYRVYAFDNSVRTAWLDSHRGFFNGTSLYLRVHGQEAAVHRLEVHPPSKHTEQANWQLATALTPESVQQSGFGSYLANSYDELVDAPVEMGSFWSGSFVACGVPHRFVVAGAPPSFDGARLLTDTQSICETAIRFWDETGAGTNIKKVSAKRNKDERKPATPFKSYLFMLNAVDDGYGGLEHNNSTALICTRKDLPRLNSAAQGQRPAKGPDGKARQIEGYFTLLGLISHEYFHSWNVKQLRPSELARYDYTQENYTALLWFFEGFTSYYDDLLLRRAGLLDEHTYLKLLTKTINQVLQTPGRAVQSVAQASFDAWVKYYRQDENTANATVSYYTKGSLVALCLDLTLRQEGKTTLDAVMQTLWTRCQGGPMSEADLTTVLEQLSGRSFTEELAQWVHGTADLPLEPLLSAQGVAVLQEPAQLAQRLGLRVTESAGIQIKTVLRGGAAEQAGLAAGDEWLGVSVGRGKAASHWRLTKLDDLLLYAGDASKLGLLVARDKRLLKLSLTLPKSVTTWRLTVRDNPVLAQWLGAN